MLSKSIGPSFIDATQKQLKLVMDRKAPCAFDVTIKAPRSGVVQSKINLRLPIMDTPDEVTKIMTATLFEQTTIKSKSRLQEIFSDDIKRRQSDYDI